MMKNKKMWVLIILILLLGIGFYYYRNNKTTEVQNPNEPAPVQTASSLEGCYVAKLAKDVYTLNIQSENRGVVAGALAYNNFEKDSSSGTFNGTFKDNILLGNFSFDSEGMHSDRQVIFKKLGNNFVQGFGAVRVIDNKETFTDVSKVTYDPKSTFVKSVNCTQTFTDSHNTFTFEHNALFPTFEEPRTPTIDWELNAKEKGILLASVTIPRSYMPGTNFSNARLTIGRSTNMNSCLVENSGNNTTGTKTTLSGLPFLKFVFGDAGAGNLYETTSYKGVVDGDCYVVEYTIHSTNIGNYSPDQGIREFDRAKVQAELEKIIESFDFLINSK